MSETFVVGEEVLIATNRTYRLGLIERETATRYVTTSGLWFDKRTLTGPGRGRFDGRDRLLKADDRTGQKEVRRVAIRGCEHAVSRLLNQTPWDVKDLRKAVDNLSAAVAAYEELA